MRPHNRPPLNLHRFLLRNLPRRLHRLVCILMADDRPLERILSKGERDAVSERILIRLVRADQLLVREVRQLASVEVVAPDLAVDA